MALAQTTNFKGLTISDAYLRVWNVTIADTKDRMTFGVGVHVNASGERITSTSHEAPYDLAGANPVQQAYDYLKSLPAYADAADV